MNNDTQQLDKELYNKKVYILNKLYYMITHYVWYSNNMDQLDSLIDRFRDLSNDIQKGKNEMLLKNIKKSM